MTASLLSRRRAPSRDEAKPSAKGGNGWGDAEHAAVSRLIGFLGDAAHALFVAECELAEARRAQDAAAEVLRRLLAGRR